MKKLLILFLLLGVGCSAYASNSDFNNKFIIGIYSANPISAIKELKDIGFNCVQTYEQKKPYLQNYINECVSNEVFALVYPGVLYDGINDNSKIMAGEFVSNNIVPNVIWYLADEPDLTKDPDAKNKVIGFNDAIKKADAFSTTAIIISNKKKFKDYSNIADVFMFDVYPIDCPYMKNSGVKDVSTYTRLAMESAGGKSSVWAVLQAFGYQNEKNKAWGWKREPTYDESRAMTYLAIINGANGVFYYTYHGSQYFIEDSKQNWSNIKAIVAELNTYLPILTAEASDQIIVDDLSGKNAIEYLVKKYQDKYYLFIVNGIRENVTAKIRGRAGVFTENFKPLETKIYVYTVKGAKGH